MANQHQEQEKYRLLYTADSVLRDKIDTGEKMLLSN